MIAGNLYSKLQNAKKSVKATSLVRLFFLAAILLFSVPSIAQISFNNGSPQSLSVCQNSSATSINSYLTASGGVAAYTWTIVSGPANGTLVGFPTGTAGGPNSSPSGTTFQPTGGFSGTDAFTIQVSDGFTTATTTVNITVNPLPNVTNFATSASDPCQGAGSVVTINSTSLASGTYNVTYNLVGANSVSGAIGSVTMAANTGNFTTLSLANAGATTVIITSITSAATCTSVVAAGNVAGFTVNTTPGAIFVPGPVCVGSTMTVASGTAGGTYTSSNVALATVGGGTGIVTGVGAGNPVITYTLGSGCFTVATITVNPLPAGITGSNTVCTGSTSPLADATAGGTWSSSNPGVATITSGGVVTGVTAGTPTITYTLPAGCFVLFPMTVNTTPAANTGTPVVCTGNTTTLANGTGGGLWTSSNTGQATVGAGSGVVSGVAAGNPVITYTVPNGCFVTTATTVNTSPAAIVGASGVCLTYTTTLTNATGGGTWTSSNTLLATVGAGTGLVTGVAVGTPTISYTVSNGCFATFPITVNPNPSAITGTFSVCVGSTTTLADGTGGGLWSSSNTGLATVGAGTGVVTGVAAGTPDISYTLSTGCFAIQAVTVNSSPATTTGSDQVCVGATTTLNNAVGGGTYTSSNPGLATVGGGTGLVTGIAVGTPTITYTLSNGCFVTTPMTVNANPAAIAGTFTVCVGTTTTLTDATGGGTWTSSNAGLATVVAGTGVVTGVASGTPNITYTISSGCFAVQNITVNPTPAGISGPTAVCVGANITLTDATSGGSWTSSSTGIATVGAGTGIVTGVSAGTATITYTLPSSCVATYAITVNPAPAGIFGATSVCTGATTTLTNTTPGGNWTSSDVTRATIGVSSGIVTGVAAGTVNFTYTLATGCFSTFAMTVNPTPSAITGTMMVCVGFTTTLSDATGGGSWSSSNTALATVVSGTGVVTGVASGIPTISYILPTGCFATTPVSVNPIPAAIGGTPIVCVGGTTTLTDATTGGTWTSSNTSQATIGATTGILTGVAAGNPVITYTTAAGCITTIVATVNPLPAAITGTNNVCIGFTTTFANATTGGTWTSSNTSLATIDPGTGIITGVATGVPVITYTLPTGCYMTAPVTVNSNPAAITGVTDVCVGLTTPLFDATGGGLWTSSNTGFASVGAGSGVVTGVASGIPVITYTLPTGCFATTLVTVNPNPDPITGTTNVCVGLTTTLSDATSGGTWSSSNSSQASVIAGTGVVTGVAAGTPTITYTLPTGCITTITVTVNDNPAAITGVGTVCTGFTTTLASATTGGSWSSSNIALATVGAGTGIVTGVSAGNPVITYTLATGCIATTIVTVNPNPVAIAGTTNVCIGLTTTLTDASAGGTWSSSNISQATVVAGTGVVTGVTAGVPVITYTLPTGCYVTTPVTVNPNPAAITGLDNVCTGYTIGLADATTGGTWTSSDVTRATVDASSGVVTGVLAGTPTITYTLSTGCLATYAITVNTTPAPITGTASVCTGYTTTLSDATPGGTWSSSNTAEATVGAGTGVVTGVAAGIPTISYTMSTGCYAVISVTVNQTPAAITGVTSVCVGLTSVLSSTTSGGTWSSSNTALATVGSSTGVVSGVATGTLNISYIMPTGCFVITPITVNPTPAAITGPTVVCAGSNITLSDGTSGGIWSSGNTSIATIVAGTGVLTGVAAGVAGITYTLGAGCYASTLVTVNAVPDISNFTSTVATSPCIGGNSTVTISSTSLGAGTFTVTYNLSGANAVTGATATMTMGSTNGTFTIPSSSLTTSGFTTVTVTMITNTLSCNSVPLSNNTSTFSVYPLPTVYTVTGGGAYCAGGTGVHIYLSNSVGGVNYQLYLGSTPVGTPIAGTFSGLDFGLITAVGTYTVSATNITTGCTSNMAGSASVSINPLPTTFLVTGGGSYCAGGSGVAVGLAGSTAAVNYQLYIGGVASGSPVAGTGAAITFGLQTTAGTYTVVATDVATLCTNNMTGSAVVVINPLPASITGTMYVCPGTTTTLASATSGGTWTSSTPGVATIGSSTAVVTGVSAGTTIITYTLSTGCITTATITVNPNPAAIAGPTTVCVGSSITLTDATGGGTWTSSNTSLATVNIVSGAVIGVAAGTPTITYSLSTGCNAIFAITVNPIPAAIAGASSVCSGQTTTLTNTVSGGTWTSSNSVVASVGSGTGVVTGASVGTATITYTLPAGCFVTAPFTVNPTPATITGTTNVCVGLTSTLANATSGGSWTSSNTSIATVGVGSGIVSGGSAGTVTITYTLPAGCFVTTPFTVNPTPAAIAGVNNICVGLTATLSDATSGGTWTSSNPATGTVGASTGIVGGIAAGSFTVTYTLAAGSCNVVFPMTVNANPAAITGVTNVCIGSTTTLSDATAGGTWSSSNTSLATVSGSGVVSGVATGVPTITYSMPTGCIATTPVTVNPLPASITGVATVCEGATTTLSSASSGGTWTSSNPAIGSVASGTGVVTGVTAGIVTITYTLPTGCLITAPVTVYPTPAAIAGSNFVCVGLSTTLTDATSGGSWSSSNTSLATVTSGGVVTGVAVGVPYITYTLPAGCFAVMPISVNPVPASITGTLTVCEGTTTTLSDATTGGTWTSSNTTIAQVGSSSGIVTGVLAGSATITYTLPGGCTATTVVTVNPSPSAIGGSNNVCIGLTTTLTNTVSGGTWTSSNTSLATIGASTGIVSGISNGALTITYTLPAGCLTTLPFTVNPLPTTITGTLSVCVASNTTLSSTPSGGTWSSSNTTIATVGAFSGTVSGVAAGTATITYTLPTGCIRVTTVTVNPLPNIYTVTGGGTYCTGGTGVAVGLTNSQIGINYQLYLGGSPVGGPLSGVGGALSFGLQTGAGVYTAVGTNAITLCQNNMSGTATVTINPLPTIYNITGGGAFCSGGTGVPVGLNGSQSGVNYQLYNGSTPIGSLVAGTGSSISFGTISGAGSYTVRAVHSVSACTSNMTGVAVVVINPLPNAYLVTGGGSYCTGGSGVRIGLSNSEIGVNYTATNGIVSVTLAGTGSVLDFGFVTSLGTYTITATNATTFCVNTMTGTAVVTVTALPTAFTIAPTTGAYCAGGTGVNITLPGSQSGVNYQLYLGGSPIGAPVAGGGGSISFGLQTGAGVYTAVATNATTSCTSNMTGTSTITINPLPVNQTLTGGGGYCSGGSGLAIGLAGSVVGTTYQLYRGTTAIGGATTGTGAAFNFAGLQTVAGIYTVMATITSTTCTVNLPGSVSITINPLPLQYSVTGGGSYCTGGTGLNVSLLSSDAGINYQLVLNGTTNVGSPVAGTGSLISFGTFTVPGIYTVVATNPVTNCTSNMLSSATIIALPLPTVYNMGGGGSYCAGGTGVTISLSGSQVGVNYQVMLGGSTPVGIPVLGTGIGMTFGPYTTAGIYTIVATNITTACTRIMSGTSVISINPLPLVNTVVGGGSYCAGGSGVNIGLDGSVVGINYQLYNGTAIVGAPMAGTGLALNFGLYTAAGTYTIVASNTVTGCANTMAGSAVIVVNPLPVVYTVTGGGAYCTGGTGVAVGVSNSDIGVSYQLYNGVTPLGAPVAGTGSAISFGLQTTTGTYTVVASNGTTFCSSTMSGSVLITINPLPAVYTVTGGGAYCPGGSGVVIGLSSSATGVNYQLYNGSSPVGAPVAGTSIDISFGLQTAVGTYTVVAMDAATACTSNMTGTAVVSLQPLPAAFTVGGGGGYCVGGTGVNVTLSGSATGISYQLYVGVTATGTPVSGTGALLNFGPQTALGAYTVVATNTITTCTNNMTGSVTVSLNPLPTAYTVTGGGGYCAGGTGVLIGLSSSNTSISYQLMLGTAAVGSPLAGTGSAISFGMQATAGNYTVVATNSITSCTNNMLGSATVMINALPIIYTVTGGGHYCAGGTGVHVGLNVTDLGVNYQLYNGTSTIGGTVAGTGSDIDFGILTAAGTYTVTATDAVTGCASNMSGSATITIDPLPLVYTVTGGGSYCAGSTGLHVGLAGSNTGINYQLLNGSTPVGGTVAGTGASLDFGVLSAGGTYTVVATNAATACTSNMTGSATIIVNPLPALDSVTGGGSYCPGGSGVHVGLNTSTAGVNYQLYRGTTMIGAALPGTGSGLDFGAQTIVGTYFVTATNTVTGCTSNMVGSAAVNISALPTAYTVAAGSGSYCAGGTGLHVTLGGSALGVNYQLYRSSIAVGGPVAGTGFPLDFGLFTSAGTYSVIASDATTGCVNNMTGTPAIVVNPLPTAYIVSGGGSFCAGGTGVAVMLSSSDAGVNYQLWNGSTAVGTPIAGTGFSINFGLQTTAGTYTVKATNAVTGCINTMLSGATINVNPLPTVYFVVGGGSYCAGGAGVHVGINWSDAGVNYQLYNGSVAVGAPMPGVAGPLDFGTMTTGGTYTVVATNASTGCVRTMSGSVAVNINPLPASYTVIGGGNYCTGGTGVHVGLSGSAATGVSYSLYRGGVAVGSAITGSGAALDFGLQTVAGTYQVVATNTATGCSDTMAGSTIVTISSLPAVYAVTGGGSYCSTTPGTNVSLFNSDLGINYQLYNASGTVGGLLGGTGATLSFGLQPAGTYTVVGINATTGCTSNMSGSAVVTVIMAVTPSVSITTGVGDTVCEGTTVTYNALAVNGGGTPAFQWYVNGIPSGTGSSYSFIPTNGNVISVTMTSSASCVSPATATAAVTMTVKSNVVPSVTIAATPGNSVCQGTIVTFTPTATWGGVAPVYTWFVNGVASSTGPNFSYAPVNGDVIFSQLNSNYACVVTNTALSNNIAMTVDANTLPAVSIAVKSGANVGGLVYNDTLTAAVTDGGLTPSYQWSVNGVAVAGATSATYIAAVLNNNDAVSVTVTRINACGTLVGSDLVIITSANVGVTPVVVAASDIKLVPNPNKGIFTIKGTLGTTEDQEVAIEMTNMLGQVIYTNKVTARSGSVNETIQLSNGLANGMYMLSFRSGTENKVFHVVIEQ